MDKKIQSIGRNIWQLRDILFDEMEALQLGKSSPQRAQAMSKLAAQIIESAKVEVLHGKELQKSFEDKTMLTERPSVSSLPKSDEQA